MSKALRNYIFGQHRANPVVKAIARRAEKISLAYKNFNYDAHSNGEEFLLRDVLAPKNPRVIVDVGANDGGWALLAARYCPGATVHAFEIVPKTANLCAQSTADERRIILNRVGLSDVSGSVNVKSFSDHTHSSTLDYPHDLPFENISAKVIAGDDYLAEHNLPQIDLLKIDVEGAENKVIAGFNTALRAGRIKMIQFEYGRANILSKFLLKDWYDLLTPLGYRIGKLYPGHIDFKPYDLKDEDFIGPNYVAILAS